MPRKRKQLGGNTSYLQMSMREMRFAAAFAEEDNATKAYLKAGYDVDGESGSEIRRLASALSARPDIVRLVDQMKREALAANRVTVNRIAANLSHQAFGDRSPVYDEKGNSVPPHKLPRKLRSLIRGVKRERMEETRTVPAKGNQPARIEKVRWWEYTYIFADAFEARQILARWRGMIGSREEVGSASEADAPGPLVVGGEANPGKLLAIEDRKDVPALEATDAEYVERTVGES